ncbi:MAG: class I SAM-dependent methyltransferase [Flavobacteriaceae bacterium]|nr:class I SAM-dependent methyltransferase [Flavobacteriaceae bacterium]
MQKETSNWFASWFDSPYYHVLYKDRDETEAGRFMCNLVQHLNIEKGKSILDLACGKGRHSIYLNELGYCVTGVDLSPASIAHADSFKNKGLNFKVHDMRVPFGQTFDAVFNLFTSFGYFDCDEDNLKTICAIKKNLKPGGLAVIDFMNSDLVIDNLVPNEVKKVDGITFHIHRYVSEGYILKDIAFEAEDHSYKFTEKVRALTLSDFSDYFKKAGINLIDTFGDYDLNAFDKKTSSRLILVFN